MTNRPMPSRLAVAALFIGLGLATAATGQAPRGGGAGRPALSRPVGGEMRSGDAHNRQVRVHNQTDWTMSRFYALSPRSNGREGDILDVDTLASGSSRALDVDDGSGACVFDFRAEFANGQALVRQGINVCQIADYYFTR